MNWTNLKKINLLIIVMLFFSFTGNSQNTTPIKLHIMETINSSGANATGNSGTVAYSIGQVFYTYIGLSVFNVAQGIQHEELENSFSKPVNSIENLTNLFIFPNPTTDFVTINIEGLELEKEVKSYQLYDIQGRILKQNTINQTETQINLTEFSSSIYILQVYANNKVLKTFKIIKN